MHDIGLSSSVHERTQKWDSDEHRENWNAYFAWRVTVKEKDANAVYTGPAWKPPTKCLNSTTRHTAAIIHTSLVSRRNIVKRIINSNFIDDVVRLYDVVNNS